jgi:hypothetical protein
MRVRIALALSVVLVACSARSDPGPAQLMPPPELAPAESASRRHSLAISVDDASQAASEIESLLKGAKGFVTKRDEAASAGSGQASILLTMNIELRQAQLLLDKAKKLGTVTGELAQIDDVAAEMVLTNAKLAGLRNVEARLRALGDGPDRECARLGEIERDRAKTVDEIAALVTRQKVQESRSQFASVSVLFVGQPPKDASFVDDAISAFNSILEKPAAAARQAAVLLAAWSPVIILLAAAVWLSCRRRMRHRLRSGQPPAA